MSKKEELFKIAKEKAGIAGREHGESQNAIYNLNVAVTNMEELVKTCKESTSKDPKCVDLSPILENVKTLESIAEKETNEAITAMTEFNIAKTNVLPYLKEETPKEKFIKSDQAQEVKKRQEDNQNITDPEVLSKLGKRIN